MMFKAHLSRESREFRRQFLAWLVLIPTLALACTLAWGRQDALVSMFTTCWVVAAVVVMGGHMISKDVRASITLSKRL
jgi:hypothetical protein